MQTVSGGGVGIGPEMPVTVPVAVKFGGTVEPDVGLMIVTVGMVPHMGERRINRFSAHPFSE
jgi:hypothetical protein